MLFIVTAGDVYGLNFGSETDANEFLSACSVSVGNICMPITALQVLIIIYISSNTDDVIMYVTISFSFPGYYK